MKPMPGEEGGELWTEALRIAKSVNCAMREDGNSSYFNVAPLLESITGLGMESLLGSNREGRPRSDSDDKD